MAVTSGAPSKMSLSVSGSIVSGDGDELRVVAGKVSRRSAERYLEFVVPSADLTVRASWKPRDAKGRARDDAMPLALAINGSKPVDVVARAGKLYRRDERGTSTKPFEDERLGELGRVLLAIKLKNEPPDFATFSAPAQAKVPPGAKPFGFFTWTGCVADVTGAGAGIGGAAGGVAGSISGGAAGGVGAVPGGLAGAGTGMVVGGAIGATVGLGACTAAEIYDWLWT
jgi:hypothetical protein